MTRIIDISEIDELVIEEDGEAETHGEFQEEITSAVQEKIQKKEASFINLRTYQVRADFNGCLYCVQARNESEAEDALRIYLENRRGEAMDSLGTNQISAQDLLRDMSVAATVEKEVEDGAVQVNRHGEATEDF